MGGLFPKKNAAGSTFTERAGGGNFIQKPIPNKDGTFRYETVEGVWLPSGTGEASMGTKGTTDASVAGSANVQAGKPNRTKGQSINFSTNKRKVSKSNSGSSGSSRALNIV